MLNSLRVRVFLMAFAVVAVAVAVVSLVAGRGTLLALDMLLNASNQRDQVIAAHLLAGPVESGDITFLQSQTQRVGAAFDSRILILNPQGVVMADSFNEAVSETIPLPVGIAGSAMAGGGQVMVFNQSVAPGMMFSEPITAALSGPPETVMFAVGEATDFVTPVQEVRDSLLRSLLGSALAGGSVAVLLTLVLSRRIVQPVETLTLAARRMEKGDLAQRVNVRSRDEIGTLAHAFNAMADSLTRTEQLRRQMVGDIAHELRSPLTNLRGYLEALKDGVLEPQPAVIASLSEEVLLLNRLVDDLQELALADAGQLTLNPQTLNPAEVLNRAATNFAVAAEQQGVTLHVEPTSAPAVQADAGRVAQVLSNLISNALRYTPAGKTITLEAVSTDTQVRFSVRDTGEGIPAADVPHLFERFYRADPARARYSAGGGAGLGLAIVKALVAAMGGEVGVQSEAGVGSEFWFTLPQMPG